MAKIPVDMSQFEQLDGTGVEVAGKSFYAGMSELLSSRAEKLCGKDRALLKMYLDRGVSFRQMARLPSVTEAAVRRRVNKLINGLMAKEYVICLRNREKLSDIEIKVARDRFVSGLSKPKIAAKNNCTVYNVNKALKNIGMLIESAGNGD